jgi:hypothetical protein
MADAPATIVVVIRGVGTPPLVKQFRAVLKQHRWVVRTTKNDPELPTALPRDFKGFSFELILPSQDVDDFRAVVWDLRKQLPIRGWIETETSESLKAAARLSAMPACEALKEDELQQSELDAKTHHLHMTI